jgi:secondary thiamine-phosphate synthase enzyme
METLTINTAEPKEVIDITERVDEKIPASASLCHLFVIHTTCALTTADLDPGTDLDMLDAFMAMVPAHDMDKVSTTARPKLHYRHPHDPSHVPDHILSALIGTSLMLPVENGQLILGTWQRVVLIELNGPRQRQIVFRTVASGGIENT